MRKRFEEFNRNITEAYKCILKIKAHEMQKFGLRAANVMCLFFLGKHADEGLTPAQLCMLCGEDKAGVSKSLALLKKNDYVCTEGLGRKYKMLYKITPGGLLVYEKLMDSIDSVVEKVGYGLSDAERNNFYKTLDTIVSNLQALSKVLPE